MKNRNIPYLFFLGIFCFGAGTFLSSCGGGSEPEIKDSIKPEALVKNELLARIDSLENIVYVDTFDYRAKPAEELLNTYQDYIAKFPGDMANAPMYLYKSAALCRAARQPLDAIRYYDRIIKDYPDYEKTPESAFLLAFTYDEDLNQPDRAKEAYQEVVEKYPDDKWAEQASARLENIDMSDEELIQSFMKKNNLK